MNCFNHPEKHAVGICKACQRGLCPDCAADLGHGLACKERHEQEVSALHSIVDQSRRIHSVTPRTRNAAPFFYGFMGLVFAGYGLFERGSMINLSSVMGMGFIAFAIYIYIYNKKIYAAQV
ncbi:hypothetical protein N8I74_09715 [Chitiniphilus purpureus]|uniref:B box-type domain-containing protein n=1 Tax=Chitiniphilus purpureus TaxID=2981137 RepID=A0ABY6DZJ0_9NEIS|nr:hypothetical protein [Chitiniphilus sp. CD1]UXY17263.1 hypothetical protein N8I74_09715 [Chitiniphilus sp. CD1]